MVLINKDIRTILAPKKMFTARHLSETSLSKYTALIVIKKILTNSKSLSRSPSTEGILVQHSPILTNFANRVFVNRPSFSCLGLAPRLLLEECVGAPISSAEIERADAEDSENNERASCLCSERSDG
jgi:hypothetical protein